MFIVKKEEEEEEGPLYIIFFITEPCTMKHKTLGVLLKIFSGKGTNILVQDTFFGVWNRVFAVTQN